jgi:tetrahydromethanopterin S-methyltransferase subunit F
MKNERKYIEVAISMHAKENVNDIETTTEEFRY